MKWHYNLIIGIINALEQIFLFNRPAIKVVEKLIEKNKKWGSRDRKIVSSTIFEIVRWLRKFAYLSDLNEISSKKDLWTILGSVIIMKDQTLPDFQEFSNINSEKIMEKSIKINERKIKESLPDWLDEMGVKNFGERFWNKEVKAFNIKADLVLRCNSIKSNIKDLKEQLKNENIDSHTKKGYPDALIIKKHLKVTNLKYYKLGFFEIQDGNSQKVASSCNLKSGMTIIDACAGAGGKSLHIASILNNIGKVISLDPIDFKLKELNKRANRNGIRIIKTIKSSKISSISNLIEKTDRVLIDAPCSGLGVLKRNPDAKWKMNPKKIKKLIKTQNNLLETWAKYVKKGGELIYSTCSIFNQENTDQIRKFLKSKAGKNFHLTKETTYFSYDTGFDGFYIAQLKKL